MKRVELLVPAGNKKCAIAAIKNEADAIYLGGKFFNSRMYAENFSNEELEEIVYLAHLYNVKVYVTINTIIFNDEIESFVKYVSFLEEIKVDAVIVQDIGMIYLINKYFKKMVIHASTQVNTFNKYTLKFLKKLGVKRVVVARELSLEKIKEIKNYIDEIEIFVYGALCVCFSGNCLLSYLNGKRSANRGCCAQACRLSYKLYENNVLKDSGYLLSTKDLNTLPRLNDLIESGVSSFKIEGRMKSPEYVFYVTKIFKDKINKYYLKKNNKLNNMEIDNLKVLFNRKFTTGHLFHENIINKSTCNHQGIVIGKTIEIKKDFIKLKLDKDLNISDGIRFKNANLGMIVNKLYDKNKYLVSKISAGNIGYIPNKVNLKNPDILLKTFDYVFTKNINDYSLPKVNLNMEFRAFINQKLYLKIYDEKDAIIVYGNIVEKSINYPITKEKIEEQLNKLGNTIFIANKIEIKKDNNIFINIKDINELRRNAINKFISLKKQKNKNNSIKLLKFSETKANNDIIVSVSNEKQLKTCLKYNIKTFYTPSYKLYLTYKNKLNIFYKTLLNEDNLKNFKNEKLVVSDLGSIFKYTNDNLVRTDYLLNICNDYSISIIKQFVDKICLSLELNTNMLSKIADKEKCEILIYGQVIAMNIKGNIFNIKNHAYIEDINKNKYPVIYNDNNHNTLIYHKNKINKIHEIENFKNFVIRLDFFDESSKEIEDILKKVLKN